MYLCPEAERNVIMDTLLRDIGLLIEWHVAVKYQNAILASVDDNAEVT